MDHKSMEVDDLCSGHINYVTLLIPVVPEVKELVYTIAVGKIIFIAYFLVN